jgi:hypothetical protein
VDGVVEGREFVDGGEEAVDEGAVVVVGKFLLQQREGAGDVGVAIEVPLSVV